MYIFSYNFIVRYIHFYWVLIKSTPDKGDFIQNYHHRGERMNSTLFEMTVGGGLKPLGEGFRGAGWSMELNHHHLLNGTF